LLRLPWSTALGRAAVFPTAVIVAAELQVTSGGAASAGRRSCNLLPAELPTCTGRAATSGGGAASAGRRSCNQPAAELQSPIGGATIVCWRSCNQRQSCCNHLPAELQAGAAALQSPAGGGDAAIAWRRSSNQRRRCCNRLSAKLQFPSSELQAAGDGAAIASRLAAVLQLPGGGAPNSERRCFCSATTTLIFLVACVWGR
jgi:hypothetical protein